MAKIGSVARHMAKAKVFGRFKEPPRRQSHTGYEAKRCHRLKAFRKA